MSNDDLVRGFIADAENLYGTPPGKRATFEIQVVPNALHADWDDVKNHVTLRIPPRMSDIDREGQLAHESFHVFSPAKQPEATYLDEGVATLLAKHCRNYLPYPNDAKYCEALSLTEDLIKKCPGCIRQLMSRRTRIALISASDIVAECRDFSLSDARLLVRKFYA